MARETAILAGGCFWGMQDLIRRYDGVIATRVGGVPYQVDNGVSGLLVDAADSGALAGALLQLFADPQLGQRMGAAAQALATQRYHPVAIARKSATIAAEGKDSYGNEFTR